MRSKHPKQSQADQDSFKKNFRDTVTALVPNSFGLDAVEVWFQDEARVGRRGTLTRIWAPKGSRPRVVRQQQFEAAYVFGAVCPADGTNIRRSRRSGRPNYA